MAAPAPAVGMQLDAAIAASVAEAGKGRKRRMTAERVELEKSVFRQRLADIMLWITRVLGEDVFSTQSSLGVAEEWQEVQEKKLVQQQFDDDEKRVIDALENGVVLCKLMETIVPGSCKGFTEYPKTPAACLSNLQAFIVASAQYGVEATFTSLDLFELKNLKTVVSCVNELGKRASKSGFMPAYGFFEAAQDSAASAEPSEEELLAAGEEEEPSTADEPQADEPSAAEPPAEETARKEEESGADSEVPSEPAVDDGLEENSGARDTAATEEPTDASPAADEGGEGTQKEAAEAADDAGMHASEEEEEEVIIEEVEESAESEEEEEPGDECLPPLERASEELDVPDAPAPSPPEDEEPTDDMVDLLLGMIDMEASDDSAEPQEEPSASAVEGDSERETPAVVNEASAASGEASAAGKEVPPAEDGQAMPTTPGRPSKKPDELLSPRKPQIPEKPASFSPQPSMSPKPAIPRKPEALLSPRPPEVPAKPASLAASEEEYSDDESEEGGEEMLGWSRDDFAAEVLSLRKQLKKERKRRAAAEKEVRKLKQERKHLKRGAAKSLSFSSTSMLKKAKGRSISVKGGASEEQLQLLEEVRKQKEKEEEARREVEEARKSKLSTAEQRQRLAVLHEILNTEKSYVERLQQIMRLQGVLAEDKAATPAEIQTVFSNVAQILFIHEELTSTFDQRMEQCTVEGAWECAVGDIFLKLGDFLKIYTVYVGNQAKQTQLVEDLLQHNRFVATLCRAMPDVFVSKHAVPAMLRSLLIRPIQRICKYPLLLRELIKCTEEDHPDKENLRKAMEHAESIAAFVNEKKKESEALLKLVQIQESVGDLPKNFKVVNPTRVFIREATMVKISKGRAQERHFFLFNDLLLYAAKRALGGRLTFKGKVLLNTLLVNDQADTAERQHTFELVRLDHKKKKYIICAKSEEEKQDWMTELNELITALLRQANNERKGILEEETLSEYESQLASIRHLSEAIDNARAEDAPEARVEALEQQLQNLKKSIGTDLESQV